MPSVRSYGKAGSQIKLSLPARVRETLEELFWKKRAESLPALCVELILAAIRAEGIDPFGGKEQFKDRQPGPEAIAGRRAGAAAQRAVLPRPAPTVHPEQPEPPFKGKRAS